MDKGMADSVVITNSHKVKQITIDSYCRENKISHIEILKMDIQGSELNALKGASSLLQDAKIDLIYLEVTFTEIYETQSNYFEIASFLHKKNYELFDFVYLVRGLDGKIYRGDAVFLSPRLLKNFQVFSGPSIPIEDQLEQKEKQNIQLRTQIDQLNIAQKENIERLTDSHKRNIKNLIESHKENIERLTVSHKENIEKLTDSHKNHIENLIDSHRENLERQIASHKEQIEEKNKIITQMEQLKANYQRDLEFEQNRIKEIYNSKSWKMGQLYGKKLGNTPIGKVGERIVKHLVKTNDLPSSTNLDSKPLSSHTQLTSRQDEGDDSGKKIEEELQKILTRHDQAKGIIIYPPTVDWHIPLLQRPQHMALHLAASGWLYFYCTSNIYDKVKGFHKIQENLYLTDRYSELLKKVGKFVIVIHSGHPTFTIPEIEELRKNAIIVYDYLDDIHPSISGVQIQGVYGRHKYLIENSDIVLVTADRLHSEVKQFREENVLLLSNAVDYDHFHIQRQLDVIPSEIRKIKNKTTRPIVGYFGALATWVDYDLIRYIATKRPDLEFVLIGWDYDGSLDKSGILIIENIHYLGVIEYSKLPNYAIWFDICMLPFSLNSITHATSPIKLFEYMALGKPIISTPINEALKYKSVIVATDKDQFLEKINAALQLVEDSFYLELLDQEAKVNTWEIRFGHLDRILQETIIKKGWYQDEGWNREIIKTQEELASLDPNPYYLSAYKEAENHYWLHIPKWIYEDAKKDKVNRCLDIGCAYGTLALFCKRLFNCEIYCIDFNSYMSQSLIKNYNFNFQINNIELDPFPWENIKFDIILFTEVLEHFNFNPIPTLKKIHNLLSDTGRLYVSTPDALQWGKVTKYYPSLDKMPFPNKGLPVADDHVYQFNQKELLKVLDEAGFRVVRFDYSPGVVARHFNLMAKKK
jgi:SAM-dependent methyltransferase/glycosyltransferase involved in cell wall biosynthesis